MDYYWNKPENKVGGGGGEGAAVTQREGIELQEYQDIPSLGDVAPDGWLCTYLLHYSTAAGISVSSQLGSSC